MTKRSRCRFIVWYQVLDPTLPLVTGPVHSCAISTSRRAYSFAAISAQWTYHTHCHLYPTKYSFSPESSEAFEGGVNALPKDTTSNQCPERRETWYFSENPAPSGIRNRTAGSDIDKAPRSNHCATSLSFYDYIINMVKHLFVCFTETVVTTTDGRRLVETHDITGKLQSRPLEGSALGFVGDYKPDLQVGQVRPYLLVGESRIQIQN